MKSDETEILNILILHSTAFRYSVYSKRKKSGCYLSARKRKNHGGGVAAATNTKPLQAWLERIR